MYRRKNLITLPDSYAAAAFNLLGYKLIKKASMAAGSSIIVGWN